jgi:hypothetical protein
MSFEMQELFRGYWYSYSLYGEKLLQIGLKTDYKLTYVHM